MMHWLQLVSLANSQPAASSPEGAGGLAQRGSRSFENTKPSQQGPRGSRNSGSRRACTAGAPLPLPGVPTSHSPSHEVEARKEAARAAKLAEAAEHRREETFGVLTICFMVVSVSKRCSTKKNANNGICFASQEKRCESTNCPRLHICIGCGGPKAHNECHCLQPKINALPSGSA